MSGIFTVLGATGAQGSAVVNQALKDGKYKVRAITRNTSSDKAKALQARGVEVVSADLDSEESLVKAFNVRSPIPYSILIANNHPRARLRSTP